MAYKISSQDTWFLSMHRRDPLTGGEFSVGDKVVVCKKCRTVQLDEVWNFDGSKCKVCNHSLCTSSFEREFIDFSYHPDDVVRPQKKGFKVVDSDKTTSKSVFRKVLAPNLINRVWTYILICLLIIMFMSMAVCFYYNRDFTSWLSITQIEIARFLNNIWEKVLQIGSVFNTKISTLNISPGEMFEKLHSLNNPTNMLISKGTILWEKIGVGIASIVSLYTIVVQKITATTFLEKFSKLGKRINDGIKWIQSFI